MARRCLARHQLPPRLPPLLLEARRVRRLPRLPRLPPTRRRRALAGARLEPALPARDRHRCSRGRLSSGVDDARPRRGPLDREVLGELPELVGGLLQLQTRRLRLLRRGREAQVLGKLRECVVHEHAAHAVVHDVNEPLLHLRERAAHLLEIALLGRRSQPVRQPHQPATRGVGRRLQLQG